MLRIVAWLIVASLAGALAVALAGPYVTASFGLSRGRQAIEQKRYGEAAIAFEEVLRDRPGELRAHQGLAEAYKGQYVPGGETPRNLELAQRAREELETVIRGESRNAAAVASLAAVHFEQQRYDEAVRWYERLAELTPAAVEPHARLGEIAWRRFWTADLEARIATGMPVEMAGPIADARARAALREAWEPVIDRGVTHLAQALALDGQNASVLMTMSRVARARADLAGTPGDYAAQIRTADGWLDKARAAERAARRTRK